MAPLRFARMLPNRSLRFWAEPGAGSDPLRSTDLRPRNPALVTPVVPWSEVAPSPRLRRDSSLREGHEPALGRVEAGTGQVFGRLVILDPDQGSGPGRSEAAYGLVGQLPEGVGSRKASAGPQAARFARAGRGWPHGAPLRCESAPSGGGRGRCPRPSAAPSAAREVGGSKGAQRPPRQSPACAHWVRWLSRHRAGEPAAATTNRPTARLVKSIRFVRFALTRRNRCVTRYPAAERAGLSWPGSARSESARRTTP